MKSRVFVVQDTSLNLAKATRFGELEALLPRNITITMQPDSILAELRRRLREFTSDDYLLLTGDPLAIALAVTAAGAANEGIVTVLKWDRELGDYYPVRVDLYVQQPDIHEDTQPY